MKIEFPKLTVYPNINGTSREELLEQRLNVARACNQLLAALSEMSPNGRDFQTAPEGAFAEARAAWTARCEVIQTLKNIAMEEAEAVSPTG